MVKTKEFIERCPKCNVQVELIESGSFSHSRPANENDVVTPYNVTDLPYVTDIFTLCHCPKCHSPFLFQSNWYEIPAEYEEMTSDPEMIYPKSGRLLASSLPKTIARSYEDAVASYAAGIFTPCVLMARKCLEAVCSENAVTGRDLKGRLMKLRDQGVIDNNLFKWADSLRLIGNDAAHDVDAEFSSQDASDVVEFLESVITYAYILHKKYDAFIKRRGNP